MRRSLQSVTSRGSLPLTFFDEYYKLPFSAGDFRKQTPGPADQYFALEWSSRIGNGDRRS